MNRYLRPKILTVLPVILFVVASVFAHLLAQTPEPSPSPTGSPSPSPSPSPTRSPSPTPLPGVQNFHQWGSITVFNGLPSDSVRAIAQTPDGVMWFGTDNGLARFDGRRIQNIPLGDPEVDRILVLKTTPVGDLWIGTSSGAFDYDIHSNRAELIENTQNVGITAISFEGETLLGTDDGHVLHFRNNGPGHLRAEKLLPEPIRTPDGSPVAITGIAGSDPKILVATSGHGVYTIRNPGVDSRDGVASPLAIAPIPAVVNALVQSESGDLWLGTEAPKGISGVYTSAANGGRSQRIAAPTGKVTALELNDAGLWAGTDRYGLFHFTGSKLNKSYTFPNTSGGLRSDNIFTLFTDREGVLWIGTNRGVSRFDRQGSFQETVSDIPNSNFIRSLWRTSDSLFAGSNRGLFEHDGKESWNKLAAFEDRAIYDIDENGQGIVVATATGTYDARGRLIVPGDTRSVENFNDKTYAAIVGRGVVNLSSPRQEVIFQDETASALRAGDGQLWIGTSGNGLFRFDGKSVTSEVTADVLKSGAIWNMARTSDGSIWIAGQHGVFRVASSEVERIIEAEDVRDVFVDGVDVWAATTTRGLLHARRDVRFGWLVASIGFEQGLPSEKAFSIIRSDDALLIGTNRGVVTYKAGTVPPKLIATRILSQRVHDLAEAKASIPLEYPQNSLLVEVAGQSSRTFPEEFQYAFVLKNSKGDEVDRKLSNDPQYAPTDLKPGDYAIEAIAFNRDLLVSEPLRISFSVAKAPFPWTATALGVLLVLALFGLAWAIIEHRRIVQRNRELAAARLDLANEAERERRRIARDLHDQTLADLRNLMMTTDKMPAAGAGVRQEIESISTDIRRICEDLSPSVLENVGLVAALESLLGRRFEDPKFVAAESLEERIAFPLNVQLQIYRIAQEVLTNIDRHSNANEVEMKVEMDDSDEFVLSIRDDGGVFQPDRTVNRGRGISNIRARANLINGRVAWKESRRGGNVFSLRVGPGNGRS